MMIRQWFIGIAAVCSLWGCSRSTMNDTPAQVPSNEEKMGVTLEFSSDSPLRAPSKNTTKATTNATESMTDETLVSNMVVLQYDMRNEEGQLVGVQYVDGVSQSGSNVQVSVSLEPLRKTRVVVLANMTGYFDSESVALGSSLEELNRLTFPIASTDGTGIPNDYNTALPMRAESGDITLTEGQVDRLNLTLYRLVAKVNLFLYNLCQDKEAEKYFEVTNVTLKNVPKMGSYERVTETNYVDEQFPLRDANNFTSYNLVAGDKFTEQTTSCVWYIAPNNGGTSTGNTTVTDKMNPANVPSNFCTYVEVAGTVYISGTAHPVTYRLYLGKDALNDYNVWANEAYTIDLIIRSLPDKPEDPDANQFKGFRISMRSSEMHSMSVTGWALGIQDVSVEPDPTTIPHTGDQYTITLTGNDSWGDPIPVRIWDGSEAVAQGRVAYDQYQEGGNITFLIPENKSKVTRSMSFQFQWDGTWITFDNGTQFSTALESIGVAPDPLSIPYQGGTYTITFNGLWGDDIPVRLWNISTDSEIVSGAVSYNGEHSIDLDIPENSTQQIYTIDFQYQWEGVWASIRTGAQYPKSFVTTASVSPDPTTILATGGNYTVTLNGLWTGTAEVRAWDGSSSLVSGTVSCSVNGNSGSGSTLLTVPTNSSTTTERTITFQYRLSDGEWVDIDQGIQAHTIRLTPLPLSDPKMANCAMVVPNSGQSGAAVLSITKMDYGWQTDILPEKMRAEVLWQDAPNVLRNTDITLDRNAQTITIRSSLPVEGNAVVALYNSDEAGKGEILWTWHIWVTNYRPEGTKNYGLGMNSKVAVTGGQVHTYGTQYWAVNPNKVIMDRNLGARQASYGTPGNSTDAMNTWGFYYQYGRKDPFPHANGVNSSTPTPIYGATGTPLTQNETGFKTISGNSGIDKNGTALEYATKNPLTFIKQRGNWYSNSQNPALWGNTKTAYDPCPAGWKVPPDGTWSDFNKSTFTNGGSGVTWGAVYNVGNFQAWFPGIGSLNWNAGAHRFVGGPYAYYWLSNAENLYFTTSSWIDPSTTHARADGFIVRCVQE